MYFSGIAKFAITSMAALSITACSISSADIDEVGARGDADYDRAQDALASYRNSDTVRAGGAQITDGVFVASVKERTNSSALLPAHVQTPNAVIMNSRDELTITEISARLTEITGIEHVAALGSPSGVAGASASDGRVVRPSYSGKLSEVLGKISASFGVEWTYSDGKIIFRDYVTRQYQIPVIPSIASGGSQVGSSSSGYTADFWSEFENSVDGILDSDVVYNISRTTGLLTVTAQVDDHAEVAEFVNEVSKNMSQQIAFDVNVLSVTLDEERGFGLDLDVAIAEADNSFNYTSSGAVSDPTSGMNLSIIDGDISISAIVQALSRQGKVVVDTKTGVTTVNNRPVPVEVVDAVSYVASIESQVNADTGVVTLSPQPQTQNVGFTLQLYPRIMNTSEIMVEYSLNLSELKALKTFGDGENQIQLPEVSSTNFSQQTVLENGNTLILSGFERTRTIFDQSSGVSAGGLFGIGGSKRADVERVATVVMIRPRILATHRSISNGRN